MQSKNGRLQFQKLSITKLTTIIFQWFNMSLGLYQDKTNKWNFGYQQPWWWRKLRQNIINVIRVALKRYGWWLDLVSCNITGLEIFENKKMFFTPLKCEMQQRNTGVLNSWKFKYWCFYSTVPKDLFMVIYSFCWIMPVTLRFLNAILTSFLICNRT